MYIACGSFQRGVRSVEVHGQLLHGSICLRLLYNESRETACLVFERITCAHMIAFEAGKQDGNCAKILGAHLWTTVVQTCTLSLYPAVIHKKRTCKLCLLADVLFCFCVYLEVLSREVRWIQ
jgi:hypothetical protein